MLSRVGWCDGAFRAGGDDAGNGDAFGGNPAVPRERRIDLDAARVLRSGKSLLEHAGLLRGQAGIGLRTAAGERRRIELARFEIEDDAVLEAVLCVTGVEDGARDQFLVTRGEDLGGVRLSRIILRRDLVEGDVGPGEPEIGMTGAHRGSAGDDTIEFARVARRGQHALAATGRAAREIGTLHSLAIVAGDDRFRRDRHLADGGAGEIDRRFLILHEGVIEHRALMAAVGRDHGKTARQAGRLAGSLRPDGRPDRAVQAATALKQKPPVPAIGQAQAQSRSHKACRRRRRADRSRPPRGSTKGPPPRPYQATAAAPARCPAVRPGSLPPW